MRKKSPVKFDRDYMSGCLDEARRQRATSGSDFKYQLFTSRLHSLDDSTNNSAINQEVLSETGSISTHVVERRSCLTSVSDGSTRRRTACVPKGSCSRWHLTAEARTGWLGEQRRTGAAGYSLTKRMMS